MATKTGFRDLQRTSLLRDTRISTRLWVLIGVSLVGLVYFAITSGLRVRDQARLVEGGQSIRELANLAEQATIAVADAKQNNGQSVEKLKDFSHWIAQSTFGGVASKPTTLAGRDFAEATDRLKAPATRAGTRNRDPVGRSRRRSRQRLWQPHPRRLAVSSLAAHARALVDADPTVIDRQGREAPLASPRRFKPSSTSATPATSFRTS